MQREREEKGTTVFGRGGCSIVVHYLVDYLETAANFTVDDGGGGGCSVDGENDKAPLTLDAR